MTYQSISEINASAGIGEILDYLNVITNYWAGRLVILVIGIVFLIGYYNSSKDGDFWGALSVGSFVSFFFALLFFIIGFVDPLTLGITIALTMISTAILLYDKRGQ